MPTVASSSVRRPKRSARPMTGSAPSEARRMMASPMPRSVPDSPAWATRVPPLSAWPNPRATSPRAATTPNCPNPAAKAAIAAPATARSLQRCNRNAPRAATVTCSGSVVNAARLARDAPPGHAGSRRRPSRHPPASDPPRQHRTMAMAPGISRPGLVKAPIRGCPSQSRSPRRCTAAAPGRAHPGPVHTAQKCAPPSPRPQTAAGAQIGGLARGLVAGLVRGRSIAGDCYSGFLDHQHLRGRKCHRTVQHPARNRECHTGSQFHCVTTFEFDTQATVDDVEELVLLLVLVPVVLATREHAQAEQDTANLYQGLVVPGVVRPLDRLTNVDELKRTEQRLIIAFVVSCFP